MGRLEQQLKAAREAAERARLIAEKEREKQVRKLGIEYVNKASDAYIDKEYREAIQSLMAYVRLMEDFKGVKEHGLTPQLFDVKKEMMDMVLLAGVYWDLAKIFDHLKKSGMKNQLRTYLQKYVLFAKGMPYQPLCAESLRKYIDNDKCKHTSDFKAAYTAMTGQKRCFVAGALMDVCDPETLPRLRGFRDAYLREREWGRAFIKWYYLRGPQLARVTDHAPRFVRKGMGRALDRVARVLSGIAD